MGLRKCVDHLEGIMEIRSYGNPIRTAADFLFPHRGTPCNVAGTKEVIPQHGLFRFAVRRFGIAQLRRNQLLKFVRQRVEIPAGLKMQIVPHQVMKRENVRGMRFRRRIERFADPVRPMKVTNAAGSILDIGFQLENRVAETDVSLLLGLDQAAKKGVAIPSDETRAE